MEFASHTSPETCQFRIEGNCSTRPEIEALCSIVVAGCKLHAIVGEKYTSSQVTSFGSFVDVHHKKCGQDNIFFGDDLFMVSKPFDFRTKCFEQTEKGKYGIEWTPKLLFKAANNIYRKQNSLYSLILTFSIKATKLWLNVSPLRYLKSVSLQQSQLRGYKQSVGNLKAVATFHRTFDLIWRTSENTFDSRSV